MNIVEHLRSPQKTFRVGEDGTETVEYRPPTQIILRAASIIQQMDHTIKVLQLELQNIRTGVQQ